LKGSWPNPRYVSMLGVEVDNATREVQGDIGEQVVQRDVEEQILEVQVSSVVVLDKESPHLTKFHQIDSSSRM
jgi:hypothetical protein